MEKYDIHGLVRVNTNVDFLPDHFITTKRSKPDLEIRKVSNSEPDMISNAIKRYKRFPLELTGNNNSVNMKYCPTLRLLSVYLSDLDRMTRFHYSESAVFSPFHNMIFPSWPSLVNLKRFLLQIKFLQKGTAMIHSATLSKDGRGIILPSWPNTGKSHTSKVMMQEDYMVYGDELTLLRQDRRMYSLFPTFNGKVKLDFNVGRPVPKLEKIIILKKGRMKIETLNKSDMIDSIIASTQYEFQNSVTRDFFLFYCFSCHFKPDFIETTTRKILSKTLKKVDCYVAHGNRSTFPAGVRKIMRD